jgi:hypothetical protein
MSIAQAEKLKTEFTDKWVVVNKSVPELRRFAGMTGKVKTVNMNCQALVEFHGIEDIGWYDIGTSFLTIVDEPVKKEKPAEATAANVAPKAEKSAGGKSPLELARQGKGAVGAAKKPAAGGSPLDMIRKQGASGAKPAAAPGDAGKKLSPMEQIRQQGVSDKGAPAPAPAAEDVAEVPAEVQKAPAAEGGKKLSPLDMIRKQGPAKG